MADTFAAALQIADFAMKLKQLWHDVRNAPRDLADLVQEVVVLAGMLGDLGQQSSTMVVGSNESWRQCHRLFRDCVVALRQLTDDLGRVLRNHKRTGPLRLYLRGDDLQRSKNRLENAKSIMALAQQAYCISISTTQHALVMEKLQQLERSQHELKNVVLRDERLRPHAAFAFNFQLPMWLLEKCLQFLGYQATHTLAENIQTYYVRPSDAELFTRARQRNWRHVRKMLSARTATVFDTDEWGVTLLHIAAGQANASECRFLLENGVNPFLKGGVYGRTPLEELSLAFALLPRQKASDRHSLKTARLLLTHDRAQDWSDHVDKPDRLLKRSSLPSEALSMLTNAIFDFHPTVSHVQRALFAMSTMSYDARSIAVLLGDSLSLLQACKIATEDSVSGFGHRQLLFGVAESLATLEPGDSRRTGWLKVLSTLIHFESTNSPTNLFRSVYIYYIARVLGSRKVKDPTARGRRWNEILTLMGGEWLSMLVSCGASLERYGAAEGKHALEQPDTLVWGGVHGRPHCFRVKYLHHGPEVANWKLYVVPHVHKYREYIRPGVRGTCHKGHLEYEMAGDFWNVVESARISTIMPGSFPEDNDEHDESNDRDEPNETKKHRRNAKASKNNPSRSDKSKRPRKEKERGSTIRQKGKRAATAAAGSSGRRTDVKSPGKQSKYNDGRPILLKGPIF